MKNKNIVLLSSLLLLGLASCGGNTSSATSNTSTSSTAKTSSSDADIEESSEEEQPVYSVNVKNEKGEPAMAQVQWCTSSMCLIPVTTDANGYAENKKCKDGTTYFVHLATYPTGYAYDTNGYVADKDHRHQDITIYPIIENTNNTITEVGVYTVVTLTADTYVEYDVALEAGTYNFVSWYDYGTATSSDLDFDPSFAVLDTAGTEIETDNDGGYDKNFSYDLTVKENCTYKIGIKSNKASSFNFNVTKK